MRFSTLLLLICVVTAGCSTTGIRQYNAYEDQPRGAGEVALLHVPANIMVDKIDGRGRYYPLLEVLGNPYRGARIALLPGRHEAEVIYHFRDWFTSDTHTVAFEVEAGRHYEIRADITTVDHLKQAAFTVVPQQSP